MTMSLSEVGTGDAIPREELLRELEALADELRTLARADARRAAGEVGPGDRERLLSDSFRLSAKADALHGFAFNIRDGVLFPVKRGDK